MKVLDIFGDTSKNWDKKLSEREDSDKDLKKSEEPNGNNNDSRDQYVDPELQRTMSYAKSQFPSYKDPQLAFDKWVQNNINRSEERDLEHDEEIENLYRKLNQVTTDLQRIKELQRTAKLGEERQRLDPKCWKGYRKVGTKIKGGVRVNDCKKIGEDQFEGHGVLKSTDTTQQAAVRAAITRGMQNTSQMGRAEYDSQKTKTHYFDPQGYYSDQLIGIEEILPNGTVVVKNDDFGRSAAKVVKKMAALGGMPGVKIQVQDLAADTLKEIGYSDELDSSNFSQSKIIKLSQIDGQIDGHDVFAASSGNQTIYFLRDDDRISAFIGFENGKLKNIKNFTNTPTVIRLLLGYIVHIKREQIKISSDEPLTSDGLTWVIGMINSPRGLKITDQHGEPVDVNSLKKEWLASKSDREYGVTGILIGENLEFGNRLRSNETYRKKESLLMPHIFYKIPKQGVMEEKDSFGYPSYTIEQLQRMFRNGTWEPMSDLKPNSHVQLRNTTTGGRKTVHVKPNDTKQFEDKAAKVEAWGYMYNNQDRRIVWRKIFTSGEAAYRWADQRNATVLGTRETEDSNTEPRKPLFKESTVSIRRTTKMSTLGERKQQYQLLDALGRNIAVFESARRAQHIYTALTRLREALEVSNANPTDRVTMDIPLLLRVLEYAKEDAKTDMDLHDVTENLIDLSKSGQTLSMKDYESVVDVSDRTPEPTDDQINEVGDRYWCKNERRWKDRS
jgi:hypothetical protein